MSVYYGDIQCDSIPLNPFTAPTCTISGLKSAHTCLQTAHLLVSLHSQIYFSYCVWMQILSHARARRKKEQKKKVYRHQNLHFQWLFPRDIVAVKGLTKNCKCKVKCGCKLESITPCGNLNGSERLYLMCHTSVLQTIVTHPRVRRAGNGHSSSTHHFPSFGG